MKEVTYAEALREALQEEMSRDPSVVLLGEDIAARGGCFGVTRGLLEQFGPERVVDTPISEDAIVGISLGAALNGLRPVPEIMFSSFIGIAMDQLYNHVSTFRYMTGGQAGVPLVIRTTNELGRSAAAQHSGRPEAWFIHVPGLKVAVPSTPYDAKGLMKTAIRDNDPVVFFEHSVLYYQEKGLIPEEEYTLPFGVADVKREGRDITIVAYHTMLHKALAAAQILAEEGIEAEVIDPMTLVPLDEETLVNSVKKTNRLVIAEDGCRRGGVGAELAAVVAEKAFDHLDAPIERVAAADVPIPFSPPMEQFVIPHTNDILQAVRRAVAGIT